MTAPADSAGRRPLAFVRACLVFLALVTVLAGGPAAAQTTCDRAGCGWISCGTPVAPAPQSMWGELQPVDAGPLPALRDSSAFQEFFQFYSDFPWYTGLDVQNGFLLTSMAYGLKVWDLRTHPAAPDLLSSVDFTAFPVWVDTSEDKWPLSDVAMPPGDDSIAVTACHSGVGFAAFDLTDKTKPALLYQSHKKNGEEVYTATIGGTQYAFMGATAGNSPGGVFVYNLAQARQYRNCFESAPTVGDPVACPGVYVGKVGNRVSVSYLHGVDNFITFSSGSGGGFEIWDVSNPAQPRQVLLALNEAPVCLFDIRGVYGLAMWKGTDSHYYLAMRTEKYSCALQRTINEARIYDVSCITGTCTGLGNPVWSQELDTGTSTYFVTLSRSFTTPYLYFGSDDRCRGGGQREYLYDVTTPASPREVTPPTGYWGWYYRGGTTGFNYAMPRRAKFYNEYLYRTMLSFFDFHRHTIGVPPTASFVLPAGDVYPGTPVTFQDTSTGFPTTWTWTFTDVGTTAAPPPNP